jgi:hypothetical protein
MIIQNNILTDTIQLRTSTVDTWSTCIYNEWQILYKWWSFYGCNWSIRIKLNN